MTEPIFLSDEVINLAHELAKEVINDSRPQRLGPFQIRNTNGEEVSFVLCISYSMSKVGGRGVSAEAYPPSESHKLLCAVENNYTVKVDALRQYTPRELSAKILHELTHVVDPVFLTDCEMVTSWRPEDRDSAENRYALESEHRAFTAMWAFHMKEWIAEKPVEEFDLDGFTKSISSYSSEFVEFGKFDEGRYWAVIQSHFGRMAEHYQGGS